ncbi:MAG: gliding motility-associated C-terminal domain-containing protein [Gemmatimonadaceae bacterium]|nr:gliding motility-associated C-terminal domain-containing protein [Chitinophagaceae bacterium]
MLFRIISVFLLFTVSATQTHAQVCTTLGQTPATAFPVCGTSTFVQNNVPICRNGDLAVPCADAAQAQYGDKNPYYYKFTCFVGGTLSFRITPDNITDDYDWQLYDMTGRNPTDIFTDPTLFVCGNWVENGGITGAATGGTANIECAGPGNLLTNMPTLVAGHNYLLMVSHFTDTQIGYKLNFGGGTAVITDTTSPRMKTLDGNCGGRIMRIKLNKKMKCASLAANGSDFTLSSPLATIVSATGIGCANGFEMDSVFLTLSNDIPSGNYTITIKNGTDGNTLRDNCDVNIPVGTSLPITIFPVAPTPFDSISRVGCAPNLLNVIFRKPIKCASVAANGSDFRITGPGAIAISGATVTCANGLTTAIQLNLSAPIQTQGNYTVTLFTGTDGNTLLDECDLETPAGQNVTIQTADTVSADFTFRTGYSCLVDTIAAFHDGRNGVSQWTWDVNNLQKSNQQNPVFLFSVFGNKTVRLKVSNGVCSDSASVTVNLDNELNASFSVLSELCPEDSLSVTNTSIGQITSYSWDFGNGTLSADRDPLARNYPKNGVETKYDIRLIITNAAGCFDTATHKLTVLKTCYIDVPSAFSPNGDQNNDFLYPLNAYKASGLEFNVYNRLGQRVFHTTNWRQRWDGKINGQPQSAGVYVWTLKYTHIDTGKKVFLKGSTVLLR